VVINVTSFGLCLCHGCLTRCWPGCFMRPPPPVIFVDYVCVYIYIYIYYKMCTIYRRLGMPLVMFIRASRRPAHTKGCGYLLNFFGYPCFMCLCGSLNKRRYLFSRLLYNGYRVSFPGVKRLGRHINHPPQSSAEVKEIVELYFCFPSGPSWPVLG
jgi:hypothetical protein